MKQFVVVILIPIIASIFITINVAYNTKLNQLFFEIKTPERAINSDFSYLENFNNEAIYENQFLSNDGKTETIYLLGSSELTSSTPAIPYLFITTNFKVKVKAVGHAGNQCLSIFSQLLACKSKLEKAPIVIILSPSWFQSKNIKGTPSDIYLEFNSIRFLNSIIKDQNQNVFNAYLYHRIADLFNDFNSPNLELKLMNFTAQSSKSFLHAILFAPVLKADNILLNMREQISPLPITKVYDHKRVPITSQNVTINWDSLFTASSNIVLNNASNNSMAIANSYYESFKNKKGAVQPVKEIFNQELQDLFILLKFLKANHANASFIISPLNPYYYKNIQELTPTINKIEQALKINEFNYFNMFEADSTKYDKALLFDVMHLSDYGWYKIDNFIINNYQLCYEK